MRNIKKLPFGSLDFGNGDLALAAACSGRMRGLGEKGIGEECIAINTQEHDLGLENLH